MQMVSLRGSVMVPATVLVSDGIVKKRNFFQTILGE